MLKIFSFLVILTILTAPCPPLGVPTAVALSRSMAISFNGNDLDQLIHDNAPAIQQPADLEKILPLQIFKNRRTFVFSGDSPQGGSFSNPRRIYFSPNLIVALRPGDSKIEEIEYVTGKKPGYRFYLYDVINGKVSERIRVFADSSAQAAHGRNCFQCHKEGLPIFSQYRTWCGFYGGDDDKREDEFENFLQSESRPWIDSADLGRSKNEERGDAGALVHRPNLLLTKYLTRQNAVILAAKIKNSPYYSRYRDALIYLTQCPTRAYQAEISGKGPLGSLLRRELNLTVNQLTVATSSAGLTQLLNSRILKKLGITPEEFNLGLPKERLIQFHPEQAEMAPACSAVGRPDRYQTESEAYVYNEGLLEDGILFLSGQLIADELKKSPELMHSFDQHDISVTAEYGDEVQNLTSLARAFSVKSPQSCEELKLRR